MVREPTVLPGYEEVASRARVILEASGGGALCVYVGGVPVLDIWAGLRDPERGLPWEHDTMAMSWSTTKGVASTVLHMLVERGRLAYDEAVAAYWPEFGVNGKHAVTVRHVLAMEAGLYDVRHLIDDPQEMLDHQAMSEALAVARPAHAPGSANGYHAFTYGWIVGELVRRISGDSLGSVVRSQIAEPLDLDGCYIGTPVHEIDRVAARPKLKPESAAARTVAKLIDPATRLIGFSPARFAAAFLPRGGSDLIPRAEFLSAEVPAVNGVFTARSLARLYAVLGSDDGVDGIHLWTGQTRAFAAQRQNHRRDLVVPIRAGWQLGFHPPYPVKHTSERAFGFYGAYGSGGFADPDREVGVGFVVQEAKGIPLAKLAPLISAAVDRQQRS